MREISLRGANNDGAPTMSPVSAKSAVRSGSAIVGLSRQTGSSLTIVRMAPLTRSRH